MVKNLGKQISFVPRNPPILSGNCSQLTARIFLNIQKIYRPFLIYWSANEWMGHKCWPAFNPFIWTKFYNKRSVSITLWSFGSWCWRIQGGFKSQKFLDAMSELLSRKSWFSSFEEDKLSKGAEHGRYNKLESDVLNLLAMVWGAINSTFFKFFAVLLQSIGEIFRSGTEI